MRIQITVIRRLCIVFNNETTWHVIAAFSCSILSIYSLFDNLLNFIGRLNIVKKTSCWLCKLYCALWFKQDFWTPQKSFIKVGDISELTLAFLDIFQFFMFTRLHSLQFFEELFCFLFIFANVILQVKNDLVNVTNLWINFVLSLLNLVSWLNDELSSFGSFVTKFGEIMSVVVFYEAIGTGSLFACQTEELELLLVFVANFFAYSIYLAFLCL